MTKADKVLEKIRVDKIDESPFNKREKWGSLQELAESILQGGLHEPVCVRPRPKGRYELVFGHRRLRAVKLISSAREIDAVVREMSDDEVVEAQLVENLQREDVGPVAEADGFQWMLDRGLSVAEIGQKIGKSEAYVYGRLRIGYLHPQVKLSLAEGAISLGVALEIARVHSQEQQAKALDDALNDSPIGGPIVEEVRELVKSRFLLRLASAKFDRADANLVPKAGPCTTCPKRTGAQPDLFGEGEKRDDLCTDGACFKVKTDAAWTAATKNAADEGRRVLSADEAKSAFQYGRLKHGSKYVDLDSTYYVDGGEQKTFRDALKVPAAEVVLARTEDGEVHHLVERAVAAERVAVKGKEKKALVEELTPEPVGRRASSGNADKAWQDRQRKAAEQAKQKAETDRRFMSALVERIAAHEGHYPDAFVRALASAAAGCVWYDTKKFVVHRRGLEHEAGKKGAMRHGTEKLLEAELGRLEGNAVVAFLAEILLVQGGTTGKMRGGKGASRNPRDEMGKIFGVVYAKVADGVANEHRLKRAERAKKARKAPKK